MQALRARGDSPQELQAAESVLWRAVEQAVVVEGAEDGLWLDSCPACRREAQAGAEAR